MLKFSFSCYFLYDKFSIAISIIQAELSASEVSRYSEKLKMSESSVVIITEPRATVTEKDLQNLVSVTDSLEEEEKISAWKDDFIPEEVVQVKPNPG